MLSRLFLPSTAAGVILKSPQFGLQLTPGPSRHPPVTKAFSCCFSIDRNRLRGALPRPTMGAHQSAVRGMDIFEKVIRKDAPLHLPQDDASMRVREGRVVRRGHWGFESTIKELPRCMELFNVMIDRLCQCFGTYIATIDRPWL